MRPSWTYKLRQHIISIEEEDKDLGVVIQDNLSPEKHINKIFVNTFKMLRNKRMAFHFLDKDMVRKILTSMIRPKLEYSEAIRSPQNKKHVVELERKQKIENKMVQQLKNLIYEEI